MRAIRCAAVMGIVVSLMLVSCTGTPPAQTVTPTPGGTIRAALALPPTSLDVHRSVDNSNFQVGDLIYEGLFRMSGDRPEPWLAERVDVSPDGTIWSLKLRAGVKFHDGTDFDSAAVKANIERIQQGDQGFPYRGLIAPIAGIKVLDRISLELHLNSPSPTLRAVLAFTPFAMQSPTAMSTHGDQYSGHAAGTGPFKLVSWTPGIDAVVRRFDGYWGAAALLDEVRVSTVRDSAARVASLEAGSIDIAAEIPGSEVKRLQGGDRIKVSVVPTPRLAILQMNNLKKPLDNKLVRQAIMYGTNRQAYIDVLFEGLAEAADSLTGPGVFGYSPQKPYPYDPQRARQLLSQAGVPNGTTLELVTVPGSETLASAIAQDLAQVGLTVKVVRIETAAFGPYRRDGKHELAIFTRISQYFDAELPIGTDFHSTNWPPRGTNAQFYKNADVDTLLDKARVEMDSERRAALFVRVQVLLWEDLPAIPLYRTSWAVGVSKAVEGLQLTSQERLRLDKAWLRR